MYVTQLTERQLLDINRNLDKIAEALKYTEQHLGRMNESNAALHGSDRVMYSPLYQLVTSAQGAVKMVYDAVSPFEEDSYDN